MAGKMKDFVVFTVQAEANSYQAAVDAAMGYPVASRRRDGGSSTAVAPATLHHQDVIKHPVQSRWAYERDRDFYRSLPAQAVAVPASGAATASLDPTWGNIDRDGEP